MIGKPEGRNQMEDLGVDGKEKLKTYFQERYFILV
jgi:hypothetical protein